MAIGTAIFFAVLVLLGITFRAELEAAGAWIVDLLGYPGIGIGIMASDMLTLPIPPDVYLALAVAAGLDPWLVILWGSAGSILGGIGAYFLGRLLGRTAFAQRLVEPFRERGTNFINRMGVTAVIVAALTPIPFSIVCTLSGMLGMEAYRFLPATLFRIPRIAGYFLLIKLGWGLTGG
jgi:membrane protein YqaA with SNARE-associated domain